MKEVEKVNNIDSQKLANESCGSILSEFRGLQSNDSRRSSFRQVCGFSSTRQGSYLYGNDRSRVRRIPQNCQRYKARAGFGMMFAIILTILVATLGVLAVKFSTQTLNTTTNEYIAIQLDLYLNSTAELAILYVQRNGFVCEEGVNCNLGKGGNTGNTGKRPNVKASIEKYISYGANNEYAFKYKITPLDNYDRFDFSEYQDVANDANCEETKGSLRCFKEETKNAFVLDISGSVTNPITHQTLRVTKRQIIKP